MREIKILVNQEFCNDNDESGINCPLLAEGKYGHHCKYFNMYLLEGKKSDDGITYNVLPCQECLEGGFKTKKTEVLQGKSCGNCRYYRHGEEIYDDVLGDKFFYPVCIFDEIPVGKPELPACCKWQPKQPEQGKSEIVTACGKPDIKCMECRSRYNDWCGKLHTPRYVTIKPKQPTGQADENITISKIAYELKGLKLLWKITACMICYNTECQKSDTRFCGNYYTFTKKIVTELRAEVERKKTQYAINKTRLTDDFIFISDLTKILNKMGKGE